MRLSEAKQITEVFGVEAVNAALLDGWIILAATSATRRITGITDRIDVCYTLGKTAEPERGHYNDSGESVPQTHVSDYEPFEQ